MNKKTFNKTKGIVEELKSSGVKVSRANLWRDHRRYLEENRELITEGQREMRVLNMKRFYKKRGWKFPPKSHKDVSICHLLNVYYEKDVCKHIPQDELEKVVDK